ncbi:hypothetical protein Q9R32_01115 [Actinotalea sp. AC32]|nr:hypothetical protein [Actinotalea sp. AC32]
MLATAALTGCVQGASSADAPVSVAGAAVAGCLDAGARDHGLAVDADGALGAVEVAVEDSGWWAVVVPVADDDHGDVMLRCTVVPDGDAIRVASSSVDSAGA